MKRLLALTMLTATLGATGCSHAMHITNLHEYAPTPVPALEPTRTVGVTSRNVSDPATRGYVDAIADGLRRDGSFARVIYPFDAATHASVADVVVDVAVTPQYSGQGTNFLVNWPGFLIFAPAIWGYGYQAAIDTKVNMSTRDGYAQQLAIPTLYRFRQAEMDRTWTEIGWLEVGIIPLIGGAAFTKYDTDVTPEFVSKVGPNYGAYVAQRIHAALAGAPTAGAIQPASRAVPSSPPPAAAEPQGQRPLM